MGTRKRLQRKALKTIVQSEAWDAFAIWHPAIMAKVMPLKVWVLLCGIDLDDRSLRTCPELGP